MEVVYEGILEIGQNPDSKSSKDWKPRLFVLKRHPLTGRSSLDFYKSTSKRWQKQSIMGVLSMWPEFEVSLAHQCPYKYTLKLSTTESTVYLACNSQTSMNKWFYHIQTQRTLEANKDTYIYNVKADDTNALSSLGVYGDCQLAFTPNYEIVCAILPTRRVAGVWPLDCLRSFSYGGGVFSLTSGRHAPRGPGEYSFKTLSDHLIHERLVKLIARAKHNSVSSNNSNAVMDSRPPAKLPIVERDSSSDSSVTEVDEIKEGVHENVYMGPPTSPSRKTSCSPPPPLPNLPPPKIPPRNSLIRQDSSASRKEQTIDSVSRYLRSSDSNGTLATEMGGDHMYSHTLHATLPKTTPDENPPIYHLLKHDSKAGHDGKVINKNSNRYEMAYPDQRNPVPTDGAPSIVYDTAYNETDGHQKTPHLATLPPIPGSLPEGMTANPLYGSKGNLLEDIMSNQVFDNPTHEPSPPLPPKPKSLSSSPELSDIQVTKSSRPDITANPVYVSSNIGSKSSSFNTSPPIENCSPPLNNGANNHEKSSHSNSTSPPAEDVAFNIPKGYSKVKKHISESLNEMFIPGSMESDPPPVPERLGSFNED